ncbi:MAG: hypothetical protein WBA67_09360 [Jannaschia sp.]
MARITSVSLSGGSHLSALWKPGDFLDCHAVASPLAVRPAAEIIADFPSWTVRLLRLRNVLVVPFGLSAGGR